MTADIDKLFVYGTLLQGEVRNHFLHDCRLIGTADVPGNMYDTGRGYPTAIFDEGSDAEICGEVYLLCENKAKKLKELDDEEGTGSGLYNRIKLRNGTYTFYAYEAGEQLSRSCNAENKIEHGNWRRYGSTALNDPIRFAVTFEEAQKRRSSYFCPDDSDEFIFLRGNLPILVTAPHAAAHVRMQIIKSEEVYTGALSVVLHALTGCHSLFSHSASRIDPNYYEDAPFKKKLSEIVKRFGIKLILDLHGTSVERKHDIYPGIGRDREFLLGNSSYLKRFEESAEANGLSIGGLNVFPAYKQMTVTKFAATELGVPAVQIEINKRLRDPRYQPGEFEKLVKFLRSYIESVGLAG